MSARVRVARLDAESQAQEHGFRVLEFVCVLLQAQERARAGEKFVEVNRLAEKIVRAGIDSLNAIFGVGKSSDKDDGRQPRLRRRLDTATDFQAGHSGHEHIEKNQVWLECGAFGERRSPVMSHAQLESFTPQESFQGDSRGRFVVYHKNPLSHPSFCVAVAMNSMLRSVMKQMYPVP